MDAARDLGDCIDPERAAAATTGAPVLPPPTTISASRTLAAPLHATSQPEMHRLAAAGRVPAAHVDPRPPLERVRAWLRHAEALEAVRVIA
jgi:hypothetical protein